MKQIRKALIAEAQMAQRADYETQRAIMADEADRAIISGEWVALEQIENSSFSNWSTLFRFDYPPDCASCGGRGRLWPAALIVLQKAHMSGELYEEEDD